EDPHTSRMRGARRNARPAPAPSTDRGWRSPQARRSRLRKSQATAARGRSWQSTKHPSETCRSSPCIVMRAALPEMALYAKVEERADYASRRACLKNAKGNPMKPRQLGTELTVFPVGLGCMGMSHG